jgi:hypothetical protein
MALWDKLWATDWQCTGCRRGKEEDATAKGTFWMGKRGKTASCVQLLPSIMDGSVTL